MPRVLALLLHPARFPRLVSLLPSVLVLLLWITGCTYYTSVGLDYDQLDGMHVQSSYYRIRWPGDGSLWLGGGHFHYAPAQHALEPLDLAAVVLQPPRRPIPITVWNKLGLWWSQTSDVANGTAEYWIGFPGWLPVLVTGTPILAGYVLHRKSDTESNR